VRHSRSVIAGVHGEKIMKVRQTQTQLSRRPVRPNPRAFRTPRNSSSAGTRIGSGVLLARTLASRSPAIPTSSDGSQTSETSIYQCCFRTIKQGRNICCRPSFHIVSGSFNLKSGRSAKPRDQRATLSMSLCCTSTSTGL